MPVTSQVGGVMRHRHVVSQALGDLLLTSWANIRFEGLIGLYASHFDDAVQAGPDPWAFFRRFFTGSHDQPAKAQATKAVTTTAAATTNR